MINHCQLAHPNPIRQEQEKVAHGYIYKQKRVKDVAEQSKNLNELRSRPDYKQIREILEELTKCTK